MPTTRRSRPRGSRSCDDQAGDELVFDDQSGITGTYDAGTGVLTLAGSASVADYQAALRSIGFRHAGDDPAASKTLEYRAGDGDGLGPAATRTVAITRVNDAPAVDTTDADLGYTEGDGPVAADDGITLADPDSALMSGATVRISGNFAAAEDELAFSDQPGISGSYDDVSGTLTLSGSATAAAYQAALRSVTYENSENDPSTATRTVSFQATDAGALASNVATRDVTVAGANDAPVVTTSGGSTAYTENAAASLIDTGLTVTDVDDTDLEGATVTISAGLDAGDELLVTAPGKTVTFVAGTLTIGGTDTVASYQTILRSVQFRSTHDNPETAKTVEFIVDDGDEESDPAPKSITVTRVNDAPALDTTDVALAYPEGAGPVAADPGYHASPIRTRRRSSSRPCRSRRTSSRRRTSWRSRRSSGSPPATTTRRER